MVSINVPKRGIFTCDCKTTDEAIQFLKSKLLGAWMCVDMVSIESCRAGVQNGERERERENTQFIFLFVPVVVITGVMGATFQVNFYQTLYFIHLKTQSLGGIDKHPGPGVVKRWLHGCLGQGCRSKPGTATCCCLAVHISWAPRSS